MGMIYVRDKSSKKRKPTKQQRELAEQWEVMMKKYTAKVAPSAVPMKVAKPFIRQTPHHPSLNSGHHDTSAKPRQVYTGTKILGIGTMHKSNSVPIFSDEEAIAIATMRRN